MKTIFNFRIIPCIVALLFFLSTSAQSAETNEAVVVCLGDSITHYGFPEELAKMVSAKVINAGVNGNNSRQGLARLQKSVLVHKPNVVFVLFGTNDNRQDSPTAHVPLPEYEANLTKIIEGCRGIGAKVILGTIPPVDPVPYFTRHVKKDFDAVGGLDKLVAQYRDVVIRLGKTKDVPIVDLNQLLAKDTSWRSSDGVHPTKEGNTVIATFLSEPVKAALKKSSP